MEPVEERVSMRIPVQVSRTPALLLTIIALVIAEGFVFVTFIGSTTSLLLYSGIAVIGIAIPSILMTIVNVPLGAEISHGILVLRFRLRRAEIPISSITRPPIHLGPFGVIVAFKARDIGGVDTFFANRALGNEIERELSQLSSRVT